MDLSNNSIVGLPQLSFSSSDSLHSVNLRGNPLDMVHEHAFANLFALEIVHLVGGKRCGPGAVRRPVEVLAGESVLMCVRCPLG